MSRKSNLTNARGPINPEDRAGASNQTKAEASAMEGNGFDPRTPRPSPTLPEGGYCFDCRIAFDSERNADCHYALTGHQIGWPLEDVDWPLAPPQVFPFRCIHHRRVDEACPMCQDDPRRSAEYDCD